MQNNIKIINILFNLPFKLDIILLRLLNQLIKDNLRY
jgi:hypothetical protein